MALCHKILMIRDLSEGPAPMRNMGSRLPDAQGTRFYTAGPGIPAQPFRSFL